MDLISRIRYIQTISIYHAFQGKMKIFESAQDSNHPQLSKLIHDQML